MGWDKFVQIGQRLSAPNGAPAAQVDFDPLRKAANEACDLLAERTYGSPARSPGHNTRLLLERALKAAPVSPERAADLETLVRECARDLHRNASGGDDYPGTLQRASRTISMS
ncbi:hypothetical protein H8A97_11780 [Bradyrhizobium sp. Arg62]|uniref:hypothetical protein n=1 Tax=Bradyrhizobium brasilense TaxID=1419277 RepID=UPI001E36D61E|nr:hypothetical protein [Bradyrhizobium brasilense]MCC8945759.1 hypothetical protein [Bradyrhizobium brasilense]